MRPCTHTHTHLLPLSPSFVCRSSSSSPATAVETASSPQAGAPAQDVTSPQTPLVSDSLPAAADATTTTSSSLSVDAVAAAASAWLAAARDGMSAHLTHLAHVLHTLAPSWPAESAALGPVSRLPAELSAQGAVAADNTSDTSTSSSSPTVLAAALAQRAGVYYASVGLLVAVAAFQLAAAGEGGGGEMRSSCMCM